MTTITLPRAVVEQALEALRELLPDARDPNCGGYDARDVRQWRATAGALRAALAQQAEPQDAELSAALGWPGGISEPVLDRKTLLRQVADLRSALAQQAEPVEPVAWVSPNALAWELYQSEKVLKLTRTRQEEYGFTEPLCTAPPQRKPLSNTEMDAALRRAGIVATFEALRCIGRAVEQAHGIKE